MPLFAVTKRGVLGSFSGNAKGWRFIPLLQRSPSRKAWPSPVAALPRWAAGATVVEADTADLAQRKFDESGGLFYIVKRNGRAVARFLDAERAIGHVADQTGKHPEFVAEETRALRAVMQDDGDQSQWEII